MDTWKKFAILICIVVILVVPLTLLAVNYNGWGENISVSLTPFTTGIQKIGQIIPTAMLENGYIMLLVYILVPVSIIGFAMVYWRQDWGLKLGQGGATNTSTGNYQDSPSSDVIPLNTKEN